MLAWWLDRKHGRCRSPAQQATLTSEKRGAWLKIEHTIESSHSGRIRNMEAPRVRLVHFTTFDNSLAIFRDGLDTASLKTSEQVPEQRHVSKHLFTDYPWLANTVRFSYEVPNWEMLLAKIYYGKNNTVGAVLLTIEVSESELADPPLIPSGLPVWTFFQSNAARNDAVRIPYSQFKTQQESRYKGNDVADSYRGRRDDGGKEGDSDLQAEIAHRGSVYLNGCLSKVEVFQYDGADSELTGRIDQLRALIGGAIPVAAFCPADAPGFPMWIRVAYSENAKRVRDQDRFRYVRKTRVEP